MKKRCKIRKKRGILLEYVLLQCSILPLVFIASNAVYSWTGSFGSIGNGIVALYQRIVTIISLPIP